uniref:(northern house mosquito) hypothetical protein n=1 Tax=Culex pipiens TaxID=7175 RepID=A0A8D8K2C0_CULPI
MHDFSKALYRRDEHDRGLVADDRAGSDREANSRLLPQGTHGKGYNRRGQPLSSLPGSPQGRVQALLQILGRNQLRGGGLRRAEHVPIAPPGHHHGRSGSSWRQKVHPANPRLRGARNLRRPSSAEGHRGAGVRAPQGNPQISAALGQRRRDRCLSHLPVPAGGKVRRPAVWSPFLYRLRPATRANRSKSG